MQELSSCEHLNKNRIIEGKVRWSALSRGAPKISLRKVFRSGCLNADERSGLGDNGRGYYLEVRSRLTGHESVHQRFCFQIAGYLKLSLLLLFYLQ